MYIVQCVSSFLSLLQICRFHISHKKYIWKLKHCNNCLANKTFLAEKFKKLLPSEFGKVFSQLTWFKTFKLHLLHWKPLTTANIFKKNSWSIQNIFSSIINWSPARLFFASLPGPWHGRMHVDAGHLTPPSPPLSPCHLAPPSSPLLVNCPPCFSLSPLPKSLSSATPWLLNFRLKQLLSPSSSPSSPQFFSTSLESSHNP